MVVSANDELPPILQDIMQLVHDELLTDPEDAPAYDDRGEHAAWQNDPVGWCEKYLKESYTDDVKALMRELAAYPIVMAKSANAVGKTHAAARLAVWFYKCHPEAQVYTFAAPPLDNLRLLLWGEIGDIVNKNPELFAEDRIRGLAITRHARSFIVGVTIPSQGTAAQREARFSGKHAPYLMFIGDECDAVPYEVFNGIETCISGGHTRLLMMLNPREEAGPPYDYERKGRSRVVQITAFTHPNVLTGRDVIPGAVTREKTVRRINEWTREMYPDEAPNDECFEVPDFLVGAVAHNENGTPYPPLRAGWRKIVEQCFHYIVLARYPTQSENQLISRQWIKDAQNRWQQWVRLHGEYAPGGIDPVVGQDVGELGTDESVWVARFGGFVTRFHTWSGVDPLITAERCDRFSRSIQPKPRLINVDGTGVGASVAPSLIRKGWKANRVMAASSPEEGKNKVEIGEFRLLRDQLHWQLREWLRTDPTAMLPPDDLLEEELTKVKYVVDGGKIIATPKKIMKEFLRGRSPDRMEALYLTFYDEEPEAPPAHVSNYRTGNPRMRTQKRGGRTSVY